MTNKIIQDTTDLVISDKNKRIKMLNFIVGFEAGIIILLLYFLIK